MTREQFQAAFQAIEAAALSGALSIPGALARAAMLGIEYQAARLATAPRYRITPKPWDYRAADLVVIPDPNGPWLSVDALGTTDDPPLIPAPSSPQDRAVRMARQLVATARYSERGACQRALAAVPELGWHWGALLSVAFPESEKGQR